MCSIPRDVRKDEKGSDEKGGPLLEEKHVNVLNCEKRSCKHWVKLSEVLKCTV